MRSSFLSFLLHVSVMAAAVAGCTTKNNPDVCCVSAVDCARLGVDDPRPCGAGQACRDFGCVAAECATSADCTAPGAPVCVDQLCVAACREDADCAGAAGPICASDGACVGCLADAQCPASAPFCDAEDRACRGCEADAECASGVCLEMDARCAAEAEVVFVSAQGADTGECSRSAPCKTLQYALTKVLFPTRLVIHVAGGTLTLGSDITFTVPVYLDGTNTTLLGDGSGPYLQVMSAGGGPATVANIAVAPTTGTGFTVTAMNTLRLFNVNASLPVENLGGTLIARSSRLGGVTCTSGTATIERCQFVGSRVESSNCQLAISSNLFDENGSDALSVSGGRVILENNLIIQAYELADTVLVVNAAAGSAVQFNTFVNTSVLASDGVALYCDSTVDVTSNIFAYGSKHPHGGSMCASRYSLYDSVALPAQTGGVGNKVADGASMFANRASRDFHLSPMSPAKAAAESGLSVAEDFDGNPRPVPVGTRPDIGCFEAP